MNINRCEIRVRYAETDQMGVVYHANYFTWFEVGRTSLLRQIGYSYKELEKNHVLLPVIEVKCNYIEAARYDNEIIIESVVKELEGIRITFAYKIYRKEDEKLLATGYTIHTFVDKELKPVRFRKKFPDIYEKLLKISQ